MDIPVQELITDIQKLEQATVEQDIMEDLKVKTIQEERLVLDTQELETLEM